MPCGRYNPSLKNDHARYAWGDADLWVEDRSALCAPPSADEGTFLGGQIGFLLQHSLKFPAAERMPPTKWSRGAKIGTTWSCGWRTGVVPHAL